MTSCPRAASRDPAADPTSNLEEHEILKCSFRDTELCRAQNGFRFTPVVFDDPVTGWSDSARTLVSWLGQRPSATSNRSPSNF